MWPGGRKVTLLMTVAAKKKLSTACLQLLGTFYGQGSGQIVCILNWGFCMALTEAVDGLMVPIMVN